MVYIILEDNHAVTDYYFNILERSIKAINIDVSVVNEINWKKWDKRNDFIIVASIIKTFKLNIKGFNNVITRFRGLTPEESYLKRKNKFKRGILNYLESRALKKSVFSLFVSMEMKMHYESKYKLSLKPNKYYIMPCYNTELNKKSFFNNANKYSNNYFVYAGSLSIWQNFQKIVELYKHIEKIKITPTKFLVLTSEKDKAIKILIDNSIESYEVDFVPPEELYKVLERVKFGFIVRDYNIVNKVSTPTKISTYIGNGIIPIYSSNLTDFEMNTQHTNYKIDTESEEYFIKIKKFMLEHINPENVYSEYSNIYDTYYNTENHILNLSVKLKNIFC